MTRLNAPDYMRFPLTIGAEGSAMSNRLEHVREIIEQVLFTNPGERWFRPEFGVGAVALVFEPNAPPLWEVTRKRMTASLTDALAGEVDPKTIEVSIDTDASTGAELRVTVGFTLAAINHTERNSYAIGRTL
ncbi:MAG: GPW/gp25 family protein [Pseudomonadota bacterium]